jgi:hypothetical protein
MKGYCGSRLWGSQLGGKQSSIEGPASEEEVNWQPGVAVQAVHGIRSPRLARFG